MGQHKSCTSLMQRMVHLAWPTSLHSYINKLQKCRNFIYAVFFCSSPHFFSVGSLTLFPNVRIICVFLITPPLHFFFFKLPFSTIIEISDIEKACEGWQVYFGYAVTCMSTKKILYRIARNYSGFFPYRAWKLSCLVTLVYFLLHCLPIVT